MNKFYTKAIKPIEYEYEVEYVTKRFVTFGVCQTCKKTRYKRECEVTKVKITNEPFFESGYLVQSLQPPTGLYFTHRLNALADDSRIEVTK